MAEPGRSSGIVYLVGAGPGHPGLITLRGAECLGRADVVVYDSLASGQLLDLAPDEAERVPVGKWHGRRRMSQAALNELLVDRARAGKTVVRLKGGDPFLFGRGGEEAVALAAAGVRFEVVPGVTAGMAAPACAGIPVSHRGLASAVALITGHESPDKSPAGSLDWSVLARFPGTLIFYMGVGRLASLAESLVANGMPATTPAALVERGCTPQQRCLTGTVGDIAERARQARVGPPAVLVVGSVVQLAGRLRWFETRPLFGQCVAVARPAGQIEPVAKRLGELGADVLPLPAVRIEPPEDWTAVDRAIERIGNGEYGWVVFTSANGVSSFLEHVLATGRDVRVLGGVRIAVIGAGTRAELERYRLRADLVPGHARSEGLVQALQAQDRPGRLLLLRADRARRALPDGLEEAGIAFDELVVYRSVDQTQFESAAVERIERGAVDWVLVTSPAVVRSLWQHLPGSARAQLGGRTRLASISPLTSAAARQLGLPVAVEAPQPSTDALVDAVVRYVSEQRAGS